MNAAFIPNHFFSVPQMHPFAYLNNTDAFQIRLNYPNAALPPATGFDSGVRLLSHG